MSPAADRGARGKSHNRNEQACLSGAGVEPAPEFNLAMDYDYRATIYDRPHSHHIVHYVPLTETRRRCRSTGCTVIRGKVCESWVAYDVSEWTRRWTYGAERAHCNGWRYPGDRFR
jgi:hypothetical protein